MGWGGRPWPAAVCAAVVALAVPAAGPAGSVGVRAQTSCATQGVGGDFRVRVRHTLASGDDIWGNRLLAQPGGPTLAGVERVLPPLLYAVGHGGRRLTASGVYYVPFTMPYSKGNRGYGLHVADGSQIIVRHVGGPSVTVFVGAGGRERYGSCLARLQTPRLMAGYLPVLQVGYRDALGVRYLEQSFVVRQSHGQSLVSFLRVSADASRARQNAMITLSSSRGRVIRLTSLPARAFHSIARPGRSTSRPPSATSRSESRWRRSPRSRADSRQASRARWSSCVAGDGAAPRSSRSSVRSPS